MWLVDKRSGEVTATKIIRLQEQCPVERTNVVN